ncbi:hypothetical protein BB559_004182 [Furculomyces boomerangus]|uniref:trimethyllysine dioxygenase n=2 Tax=Harpellales TaxID=61421 RepID=A0A2T9YG94_9FUNG|nr:hypothetical protein BB559_004182 [Furculomyces boomerangus]PWA03304.1 hypothetical protein BB558_000523 [Smittium angustum]
MNFAKSCIRFSNLAPVPKNYGPRIIPSTFVSRAFATSNYAKKPAAVVDNGVTTVSFDDGKSARFHNQWLRDHCRCEKCVHPKTYQRIIDPLVATENMVPQKCEIENGILQVKWADEGHDSVYPLEWLEKNAYDLGKSTFIQNHETKYWGSELEGKIPSVKYEDMMNTDEGLYQWLQNIQTYGLGLVEGVPNTEDATKEAISRIGPIRETHYGAFWAFSANFEHGDLAYSTLSLPAHTDNTYYTDPAGLQLFHLLEFKGVGGEQVYVDAFNVAKQLKKQDPKAYETLSTYGTWGHQAGDEGVFLKPSPEPFPVFNHTKNGELFQVRYNNEDRSAVTTMPFDKVPEYYDAIQKWVKLVRNPKNELVVPLKPGMLIALDNWRVMHARKMYSGSRTLSGGYVDNDYWKSKLRVLSSKVIGKDSKKELL